MAQHIVVCDYTPSWEREYEREAARIAGVLGRNLKEIHHIGSTAVKGLKAKPVIDILPVVYRLDEVDGHRAQFEKLGYECLGEYGIPGRRYFRKGGDERTHQVHIFEHGNAMQILRHLAVRDYLRCHEEAAAAYGRLKAELARKYPYDIERYGDGKDAFVKALEEKALRWSAETERREDG